MLGTGLGAIPTAEQRLSNTREVHITHNKSDQQLELAVHHWEGYFTDDSAHQTRSQLRFADVPRHTRNRPGFTILACPSASLHESQ